MISTDDPSLLKALQLGALIQTSIANYAHHAGANQDVLPSKGQFDAQRAILAAAGSLTELFSEPSQRLLELSSQYFESRALHIVVDQRVADILAKDGDAGVDVQKIASLTGIDFKKLGRLMRCLCSVHIFKELSPGVFANNRITEVLVANEPLRAYILMFGLDIYSASNYLPGVLTDHAWGASYDVACTPWQKAVGTTKTRWEWLEESVPVKEVQSGYDCSESLDGGSRGYPGPFGVARQSAIHGRHPDEHIPRPEHGIFGQAMLGGGRVFGKAHLYDFPWASLGKATVVDVGGGVGGFCLQLSHLFSQLSFVVQDRGPVLKQAEMDIWPKENVAALEDGRVSFVRHDFFETNPTIGADVYWLRYILHDWSDDYCVTILSAIKRSMGINSRILVCDQVMNTTLGSEELPPAPEPLLANWGYYTRYSHQRDLAMMSIINGIERNPAEFRALAELAGLKLCRIWDCRSQIGLVELVLPESPLLSRPCPAV